MPRLFRALAVAMTAALCALPSLAGAQVTAPGRIAGVVRDEASGTPLPFVTVLVTGTRSATQTNADGRFNVVLAPGTYSLEARRIGYRVGRVANVQVAAGGTAEVELRIATIALALEAVVTTGVVDPTSGTRVPFTVGRVNAEDAPVPASNAMETIQGKVAGVTITPAGQPGSGTNILLRSPTSISKSTAPLIVVDGVIQTQAFEGATADLESMDIESIEVVKGAAAASLYGSRASSGVVQIRTKRGNALASGATAITLRSEVGSNSLGGKINWAQDHYYLTNAAGQYVNAAGVVVSRAQRVAKPVWARFQDTPYLDPTYDQVDRFFHPSTTYRNTATVAQKTDRTNWMLSFNNYKDGGVVLNAGAYDQTDLRLNLDHSLRDDLTLSFSGYHSRANRHNLNNNTFYALINQAPDVDLLQPDPDGTPYIFQPDPIEGREGNPLYVLATEINTQQRLRTQGSLESRYTPLSWLNFDGNVSYDRSDRRTDYFLDSGLRSTSGAVSSGQISLGSGVTDALNAAASANFLGSVGEWTLRSTLRALMERETNDTLTVGGTNLATPGIQSLNNATRPTTPTSGVEEVRSTGYAATAAADYQGKYIFDALIRRDGSSLFGPDARWNVYHRLSAAYRMSAEPWWPLPAINEFKLRASQGTAGGRPEFNDQYETFDYLSGGGLQKVTLGNRLLKPETATETELGVDMIVNERYSLQLSYAKNRVTDQLILVPLSAPLGYPSQWQNAGTVEGHTLEGTLEAKIFSSSKASWRMGLVADLSRNKITEFNRSCFQTNVIGYRCAGESLGAMYGFRFLQDGSELPADASARASEFQTNDDGLLVWVGPNNNFTDGETKQLWGTTTTIGTSSYAWGMPITQRDATGSAAVVKIGEGTPDWHVGLSNNVNWNNFSFYGLLDMVKGGQVYNQTNQRMYQYGRSADVDQTGKPQELKKTVDYYVALYAANSPTSYFVQPAGFVKLRELSVRYSLGQNLLAPLSRMGAKGASIGLIGRNLLTWSDYRGYDPEVNDASRTQVGLPNAVRLDSFGYPRYRTITGSVQLEF